MKRDSCKWLAAVVPFDFSMEDTFMDKPIKDWGTGIPKYTENDILAGLELHEFCTNIVAQSMQDEGYTIEGIIVNHAPTQVIANKNGQRYFVIVAGGVYPDEGKISYGMKKRFADFCNQQKVVPMFASVGLMSSDSERAAAGLALKYDGFLIKYSGNENLSHIKFPAENEDGYKAHCIERIIDAYRTGMFDQIYDLFDESIQFHSQWVLKPLIGKAAVTEYFDGKGATIQKSSTKIHGSVVAITKSQTKNGKVILISEVGKICALLSQETNNSTNWIFISPKFNEQNKLVEIALNDPALFSFAPYYSFE